MFVSISPTPVVHTGSHRDKAKTQETRGPQRLGQAEQLQVKAKKKKMKETSTDEDGRERRGRLGREKKTKGKEKRES